MCMFSSFDKKGFINIKLIHVEISFVECINIENFELKIDETICLEIWMLQFIELIKYIIDKIYKKRLLLKFVCDQNSYIVAKRKFHVIYFCF